MECFLALKRMEILRTWMNPEDILCEWNEPLPKVQMLYKSTYSRAVKCIETERRKMAARGQWRGGNGEERYCLRIPDLQDRVLEVMKVMDTWLWECTSYYWMVKIVNSVVCLLPQLNILRGARKGGDCFYGYTFNHRNPRSSWANSPHVLIPCLFKLHVSEGWIWICYSGQVPQQPLIVLTWTEFEFFSFFSFILACLPTVAIPTRQSHRNRQTGTVFTSEKSCACLLLRSPDMFSSEKYRSTLSAHSGWAEHGVWAFQWRWHYTFY